MQYNKEKKEIKVDRELSKLDKFALKFTRILEKHVDYVIISGYVSILLGRSRATEDIDIFIKKISEEKFSPLYKELEEGGFWCINAENVKEVFSYLRDGYSIRFSRKGNPMPNFEVKFPKNEIDEETFQDFVTVVLPQGKLKISSLERQVAFKRYFLRSDKDLEDAQHLEEVFREHLDYGKINKLKERIENIEKND